MSDWPRDYSQALSEIKRLQDRVEALEAALREILDTADPYGVECIAKAALDQDAKHDL